MATHEYLGKTVFQNFQTLDYGDRIWPDVEYENWQKVENKILALNTENFVISRGTFSTVIDPIDPTNVSVLLNPNGLDPSFEGSINGSYFKINETITWELDITSDNVYYLYLRESVGQIDPSSELSLEKEYSLTRYTDTDLENRIIMAIVTRSGGVLLPIDDQPEGQLTQQGFYTHIYEDTNPHGTSLIQNEITCNNLNVQTLNLNGSNLNHELIVEQTFPVTSTELNLDTLTGLTNTEPLFISASAIQVMETPLNFKYSGLLDETNKFVVYNNNTSSVKVKLFIKYRIN